MEKGKKRVVIENVGPSVDCGAFAAERAVGESVEVTADVFADGHDKLAVFMEYRREGDQDWTRVPMEFEVNDLWRADFTVREMSAYEFRVLAWVDRYASWLSDLAKKFKADMDITFDLKDGVGIIREAAERAEEPDAAALDKLAHALEQAGSPEGAFEAASSDILAGLVARHPDPETVVRQQGSLRVEPQPPKAAFSSWYELFPRSAGKGKKHGTFKDVEKLLPDIAAMGFDVLYFPPIHPMGESHRKGPNNTLTAGPDDPGSPWAIGSGAGGHKAVHPMLGTIEDFQRLLAKARDEYGIDVALDVAFQCSPDHPWVEEHPEWFRHRADGSIRCAENPPKIYQDIYPLDFENEDWEALWEELKSVFTFWAERGVRFFRVDNPHTKPLRFWQWCIAEVRKDYPDTVFLSEAFTRPKVMYRLAKAGFTQSYTYFTWRNTKYELTTYMEQLVNRAPRDYFRPNFWPNTPDILPEFLQYGGRPAFVIRLILAATLSSNYGVYGPAYELCENEAVAPGSEEYLNSEKYEIKDWDLDRPGNLRPLISRINKIRRENPHFQSTWNLRFLEAENEFVLFYAKWARDAGDVMLVAVNLDPYNRQTAWLNLPLEDFGLEENQSYLVHDLIGDDKFIWQGGRNYIDLDPHVLPGRIFRLRKRLKKETDFDYFF